MAELHVESSDERVKEISLLSQLMKRPELGAIAGLVLVTIFFLFTADPNMFTLAGIMNFMTPAAQLGILAIGAALLMIGGEFDLSVGSMVAFTGLVFGAAMVTFGLPLYAAIAVTFIAAAVMGAVNGQIVIRTGLPSFIVTLAFLFILRGLSLVGLKAATGGSTQLRGVRTEFEGSWLAPFFSGEAFTPLFHWLAEIGWLDTFENGTPKVDGIPVDIIWFVLLALVATWILLRSPFGSWIFAAGGDSNAASNSGVPVRKVKMCLFMFTACCAALVAILTVMDAAQLTPAAASKRNLRPLSQR